MDNTFKTYLALGDSYTIGESVLVSERFPMQTAEMMRNQHYDISDPDIIATTGWTTSDLINSLNIHPPSHKYDFVSLLIGVNNQYQQRSLEDYKNEFHELLNRAIFYAGNNPLHVFVLSIPDYSVTPFAQRSDTGKIAIEIDAFNSENKLISLNAGVHYIDINPISKEARNNDLLIANDGLHPSGIQYKKWSQLLSSLMASES